MFNSGLRPANTQPNNIKRRSALRLNSLPQGDQARDLMGTDSTIGESLETLLVQHRNWTRSP